MGSTIIEKIISSHANVSKVRPGDIVDVFIDARVARDFGGANVVRNLTEHHLSLDDPGRTFFTFDCNPTGSDQKYAENQHICRGYARANGVQVYDIDEGIGTHILIDEGLAYPGSTAVSTDSHANILGAIGSFGQGMGDRDIAASWSSGKIWFKTPPTVKLEFVGERPGRISAKDIVLNLLRSFGSNTLLGCAVELYGDIIDSLSIDDRITVSSMATEMGAIIILIPPNREVIQYSESRTRKKIDPVIADEDAAYEAVHLVDITNFLKLISFPGSPEDTRVIPDEKIWIDSAFIGSCTNGRLHDIQTAACILQGRKVAEHVVLKIVPATNKVWEKALDEGYIEILKNAGAMVSNAGCAGCAAGQVGQNGPGEVTISTGNRNFSGKQGKGDVYLAGPDVVAASAIAGYITTPENIPKQAIKRNFPSATAENKKASKDKGDGDRSLIIHGRVWVIRKDNIDTDMIYHNQYLTITDIRQMGKYTFDNLDGYKDFSSKVKEGDIIIAGKNFGSGSSRQQAVDCFISLGVAMIIAESFGAIFERNAINAAFPIMQCKNIVDADIADGDVIEVNLSTGDIRGENIDLKGLPFSNVQMDIYNNYGLF